MSPFKEILQSIDRRLVLALSCFAVLAGIAAYALDGALRAMVLAFFAFLVYKTVRAQRMDD
jgi:hypothetical protein